MASDSKSSIIAAISGNTLVMAGKFLGFAMTGSSAMLAEAIHTLADVMNQGLLFIGVVKSEQKKDADHSAGYGRERFIWSLISAVGIFFLGCGVTIYHGIHSLMHPTTPDSNLQWSIGVLVFALIVEGIVLWIAYKGLKRAAEDKPFFKYLKEEADPTAVAVLMEDSAACLGVVIAMICIGLSHATGSSIYDSIGSILIGILLGFIAVWLIMRNRELLIGVQIPQEDRVALREILNKMPYLEKIGHIRTEVIGADSYDIQIEIEFDEEKLANDLNIDLEKKYSEISSLEEFKTYSVKLAADAMRMMTERIDALEEEIKAEIPETKFIDIEPN